MKSRLSRPRPLPLAAVILTMLASAPSFANSQPEARPSARPPVVQGDDPFIVGGKNVAASDTIASSTVALVMVGPQNETSLCTGSILTTDMIVTAAHCVYDRPSSVHIVFAKALSPASVKTSVVASGFLANPSYNPQKMSIDQNDIAVVYFHGGLPKGFEPAHLLEQSTALTKGESVILAGYGISNATTKHGAGVLRETDVEVSNPSLGKTEVVLDQTKGHGACHGDSGGPAFVRTGTEDLLWGVTSRGYPNTAPDDCAHDVVYTKIGAHLAFLQAAARQAQ
jgi:secreted trypsin-like serine protease